MAASASFSVATAHVHFKAMPPLIELPLAKVSCSRANMPNACAMELCHSSPSSSNNTLLITPLTMKKKRVFKLFSSIITEEGMPLAANEEEEEQQFSEEEISDSESAQEASAEYTQQSEPPADSLKVYVGNLPYSCDSAELAELVQQYASPEIVEVIYDRNSGRSRGFAFVTMSTPEDVNAVIESLNGKEHGGRTLKVSIPEKPGTRERQPFTNMADAEHKVFIGNLSWDVNAEILTEVFSQYGNVIGARVLYDETGRSRGFGFVTFSSQSEVEAAVSSLNGQELEGRTMRVDLATGRRRSYS